MPLNPAPVILFVYNRPLHTAKTLNALMQNELANQSDLYIYSDGPKGNTTDDQLKKIHEVRQVIRSKTWCKDVHIIEAEKNKGLADSIIEGVTEIVNRYGKAIVLEDDIVTSTQFLLFLNKALEYYEHQEIVFGISGFTFPSKFPITGTHVLPIGSSWGWATWKSRWQSVNFDGVYLMDEIAKQKKESQFDFGDCPFFKMLQDQIDGKINSWAIRFYASMFLQNKLFVYPEKSLVTNIGFDNTGTHKVVPNNFFGTVATGEIDFKLKEPLTDENKESVCLKLKEQFSAPAKKKKSPGFAIRGKIYHRVKKMFS